MSNALISDLEKILDLREEDIIRIEAAYAENTQLNNAWKVTERLPSLLEKWRQK
jgi:hypothetical protein